MAEGLLGGVLGGEEEKPEVEVLGHPSRIAAEANGRTALIRGSHAHLFNRTMALLVARNTDVGDHPYNGGARRVSSGA